MEKVIKYPVVVVIIITFITIFLGYNIKNVQIDNDAYKFLPKSNPARVAMDEAKDIFGSSDNISVGIQAKRGSIFTKESIEIINDLTIELEQLETVEEVKSLTNSDYIYGSNGSIVVEDLVKDFNGTEEDIKELKNRLVSWDVYQDLLIAKDYSASQIIVTIKSDTHIDDITKTYHQIKELTDSKNNKDYIYHIAGIPAINVLLSSNMQEDLVFLIPFVVIVLLVALFLSFKRLSGILLPLITVTISTTWTIGLMGLLGVPLSMLGIIIPVLMMAVGSAYGIHVISHYYDDIRDFKGELTWDNHKTIIYKSLSYVKKPIALAGLTTFAGFASLSVSSVVPMRDFGIFTALGIIFALLIALTLIPALLIFNYRSAAKKKLLKTSNKGTMEKALEFFYDSFGKRKYLITFFAIVILILSALGTTNLIVDNSIIEYFKTDTHIRKSDKFLRDKFSGTDSFDIVISGKGAGVDPVLLKEMDRLSNFLLSEYKEITKIISFSDTVKRINQVMHIESEEESDFDDEYLEEFNEDFSSSFYQEDSFFQDDSFFEDDSYLEDDTDTSEPIQEVSVEDNRDNLKLIVDSYSNAKISDISAKELIDLIKNEANMDGFAYYEIPYDPQKYGHKDISGLSDLLSQYYSLTGKLDGFIGKNDDFLSPDNIKMTVMINTNGTNFIRDLQPVIQKYVKDYFPKGYEVKLSGNALAENATTRLVTSSATNSILLSLLFVFIILSIAYKSIFAGLLGIIPLGFTVLFNYGIMGVFGIKLDMSTAMVGSIAIGIGIDYTIHFLSSYNKFSKVEESEHIVTKKALMSSGKAIIFNALSVAAGFIVLVKSNFNPLMYLGVLITITMLVSSLASLTIMPAVLNIFKPKFTKK